MSKKTTWLHWHNYEEEEDLIILKELCCKVDKYFHRRFHLCSYTEQARNFKKKMHRKIQSNHAEKSEKNSFGLY